jgi:hypothetical protein
VRPSQRALEDAPVLEPVLEPVAEGELPVVPGLLVVVPELLVEPELCANAALATSATAAAVPSNFNIVELLPRGGVDEDCGLRYARVMPSAPQRAAQVVRSAQAQE